MKVKPEVQPVKRYKKPKYPTKEKVSENPDILYRVPDRLAEELYKKRAAIFVQKQYNDMFPLLSLTEDSLKRA